MSESKELREKAQQARRAASVRTESGQAADRQLMAMALRLEHQADELDDRKSILARLRP
jgi:hypothetical protein